MDGVSAEVIRSGRPLLLSRDNSAALGAGDRSDVGRAVDWLGVPLSSNKRIVGALVVKSHSKDAQYTVGDIELLRFVSTQIASAIERKQAEIWLQHIARHDPLTDLPNRTLIRDRMATALARIDVAAARALLVELQQAQPSRTEAAQALRDLSRASP